MKMLHRFVLVALVVAALVQPALATQPTVEFELDDSTDVAAYEETLPTGTVADAPEVKVQPSIPEPTKPAMPAAPSANPVKAVAKPAATPRDIPLIQTENEVISSPDIRYVTGGVGEDEARDIIASKPDYNLYVMSADSNGSFVGDARVIIARKQGSAMEIVLDVITGPLLYVALPAGNYTLSASLGAQSKRQTFLVKEKGAPRNIHLGWKSANSTAH